MFEDTKAGMFVLCVSFEKGQTIQCQREKGQNDKQWSTKY